MSDLISATKTCLGADALIFSEAEKSHLTVGFRGKKGEALLIVYPKNLMELYRLIQLYNELNVGYLLQGANTSLKGQSTPNRPVVIINTLKLTKFKIFDIPNNNEYKIALVEPGLALKDLETTLSKLGYDLPHKIGSHDFGNTFGGSAAIGCGGVRVDNKSGAPVTTCAGTLGLISLGTSGIFYNGIFKTELIDSGASLLKKIDAGDIAFDELQLPDLNELPEFMQQLFTAKSYPIVNHLHENIFSGQGYEGTQAILLLMYVVRKKVTASATNVLCFKNAAIKTQFYQEVVFAKGKNHSDALPILCESMSANLVHAIVNQGVTYPAALFLACAPHNLKRYYVALLNYRKRILTVLPRVYLKLEAFAGKILSALFTPKALRQDDYQELLIVQTADRVHLPQQIAEFSTRLQNFIADHSDVMKLIKLKPNRFKERLILQIRNIAALTTVALAELNQGVLFAFDDAIMPGEMTDDYCRLLKKKLTAKIPDLDASVYLYAHDLKQISHNDWVMRCDKRKLTDDEIAEIYKIQHETMLEAQGIPHAEHGFGDHAATDLDRKNLLRLIAQRKLNDPKGLAHPHGGLDQAYQKALQDVALVNEAEILAQQILQQELARGTLLFFSHKATAHECQN